MIEAAPGLMEYELQAELKADSADGDRSATGTTPSSPAERTPYNTLHYVSNSRRMRRGDVVLLDAGAEADYYTTDITRCFPVSGSFTAPQAGRGLRRRPARQKAAGDAGPSVSGEAA